MSPVADLPAWAALAAAFFLVAGSGLALIGSIGLVRLKTFYERVHAPTMGTTWGAGGILIASMIFFTVQQSRPVLHELLITAFVTVTTPVTLMLLARAALYRDRAEARQAELDRQAADAPSEARTKASPRAARRGQKQAGLAVGDAGNEADAAQHRVEIRQRRRAELDHQVPAAVGGVDGRHFGKPAQRPDDAVGRMALDLDHHDAAHLLSTASARRSVSDMCRRSSFASRARAVAPEPESAADQCCAALHAQKRDEPSSRSSMAFRFGNRNVPF